ncbi:hypothetical protein B0J15DRAFT_169839 [Fusarium solani]|uniref:Uncharacterized protein n=1 Tax=Fusarium solani TaxID=169388 RepID=A0A9P9RAU3_FUSSL|nr:uncharacterized protein B0J15DRAFT_169839 [Fusarium solani]KAH7272197.1 hypothetical protein B0J15DRAFT_169839 [Fusarium solani]
MTLVQRGLSPLSQTFFPLSFELYPLCNLHGAVSRYPAGCFFVCFASRSIPLLKLRPLRNHMPRRGPTFPLYAGPWHMRRHGYRKRRRSYLFWWSIAFGAMEANSIYPLLALLCFDVCFEGYEAWDGIGWDRMLRAGMIHGYADRCINARRKELRKCMINWGRRVRGKVRGCETRYEEEQRAMAGWSLM